MKLDTGARLGPTGMAITVAAAVAAFAWAAGAALPRAGVQWPLPAGVCVIAGLFLLIKGIVRGQAGAHFLAAATQWLGAAGWLGWAVAHRGWALTPTGWGLLLGGAVLSAVAGAGGRHAEASALALLTRRNGRRGWWAALLHNLGGRLMHARIHHVLAWAGDAGEDVYGTLAAGGTWEDVDRLAHRIAGAVPVPLGRTVEVQPWQVHSGFVIRVPRTPVNQQVTVAAPTDWSARSILDPVWLGNDQAGSPVYVGIRQQILWILAMRGKGKTVTATQVACQTARMTDTVLHVIDYAKGSLGTRFAQYWMRGEADHPIVDMIIGCPEDGVLYAEWLLGVVTWRKTQADRLKTAANATLMPVSPTFPAIHVQLDEGKEAVGAVASPEVRRTRELLIRCADLGRDVGVTFTITTLRGTDDYMPTALKHSVGAVWAGIVRKDSEYQYAMGAQLRARELAGPGHAYLQTEPSADIVKVHSPEILPSDVRECVMATAGLRPALDAGSAAAGDAAVGIDGWHASRWERSAWLFDPSITSRPVEQDPDHHDEDEGQDGERQPARSGGGRVGFGDLQARMAALRERRHQQPDSGGEPDDDEWLRQMRDSWDDDAGFAGARLIGEVQMMQAEGKVVDPEDAAEDPPPGEATHGQALLSVLIAAGGERGLTAAECRMALAQRGRRVDRTYVYELLKKLVASGAAVKDGDRWRAV